MNITTDNAAPIDSKEDYVAGHYTVTDSSGGALHSGVMEVRGRGNLTWTLDKKPYRLRLADSTPLLQMPGNKHWVLLANHIDRTLLRNDVAFEFSRRVGMAYTPRSRFVHVNVNGSYNGVYQLTEHIRIAPDRVNVTAVEQDDTTAPNLTGGYLIEVDARFGEDYCYKATISAMVFCLQDPDSLAEPGWEAQRSYISNYVQRTDEAVFAPNYADPAQGWAAWLDVQTTVHYYLIHELLRNIDGHLFSSTYMVKPRDGKLYFGPMWDFDLSLGAVRDEGGEDPEGWTIRKAPWYGRFFEDPVFAARVRTRWNELKAQGAIDGLAAYIDRRAVELGDAQALNFERWPIFNVYVYNNAVNPGSYQGEIDYMKGWLAQRIAWMDAQLNGGATTKGAATAPLKSNAAAASSKSTAKTAPPKSTAKAAPSSTHSKTPPA